MKAKLLLLLLFFILTSCSKFTVAVRWADTFVMSYLDDYFALSSHEENLVQNDLRRTFFEVRKHEFPKLAFELEDFANHVEGKNASISKLETFLDRLIEIFQEAKMRFEPLGQALVAKQENFEQFDEAFQENYEETKEKHAENGYLRKEIRKRYDRIIGETVGELTPEQEAFLEDHLQKNPPPLELLNESRLSVFEKFKSARGQKLSREKFVREYFTSWEKVQTAEYNQARLKHQKGVRDFAFRVLQTSTQEQRDHLVKNFRKRAAELRELSKIR